MPNRIFDGMESTEKATKHKVLKNDRNSFKCDCWK